MALIQWRDSYSVGVARFDKEHRRLVELINDMFIIVRDKGDSAALNTVVQALIEYTEYHFSSEEEAMEEANYPDLVEHKQHHADLKKKVTTFLEQITAGGEDVRTELYHFLREWLINHIVKEDKKYTEYLKPS